MVNINFQIIGMQVDHFYTDPETSGTIGEPW
jgi:hypothetical protein